MRAFKEARVGHNKGDRKLTFLFRFLINEPVHNGQSSILELALLSILVEPSARVVDTPPSWFPTKETMFSVILDVGNRLPGTKG